MSSRFIFHCLRSTLDGVRVAEAVNNGNDDEKSKHKNAHRLVLSDNGITEYS